MESSNIQSQALRLAPLLSEDLLKMLVYSIFKCLREDQEMNSDLLKKLVTLMSNSHYKDKSIIVPFIFN